MKPIKKATMNLDAIIDALDAAAEMAEHLEEIIAACDQMAEIESADNDIDLSDASDKDGYELAAAKAIDCETFAISSIDDVPVSEVAGRLKEARRAGMGIDSSLLKKIKSLAE